MSVSVNKPQVEALRKRVEEKYGQPLATHNAFIALMDDIDHTLREHLSESTLERLWGYSTRGADAVSLRTLNVLARYVGYTSWPHFCDDLHFTGQIESEEFAGDAVSTSSLSIGDQIVLAWLPDRILTIEYLGGNRFEVLESINSSLRPGDSFECLQFQYGRPLYLDHFRRSGSSREARYVVGEEHGLTSINVL